MRLSGFKNWLQSPEAAGNLRVACLCLQLTQFATNISSQKRNNFQREMQVEPTLVRLGRGEVQVRTSELLSSLLVRLHEDSALDIVQAVDSLLLTQIHIVARYNALYQYPTALWRLCKRFNPNEFLTSCEKFLQHPDHLLDVGYSLQLRKRAQHMGGMGSQISFLVSPPVQQELESIFDHGAATSLDVERKHNVDKRNEGHKLMSVATASRNSILRKYRQRRSQELIRCIRKRRDVAKYRTMNLRALAIKRNPAFFKRAQGHLRSSATKASKSKRQQIVHQGDEEALATYIEEHRDELTRAARSIREEAAAASRALSADAEFPLRNMQWIRWLESHTVDWSTALREAHSIRRAVSCRVVATEDEFPDIPRLQPALPKLEQSFPCLSILLHQEPGFYIFIEEQREPLLVYATTCQFIVWAVPFRHMSGRCYELSHCTAFSKAIQPLQSIAAEHGFSPAVQVEHAMLDSPRRTKKGLTFYISGLKPVAKLHRKPRQSSSKTHVDHGLEEAGPVDSEEEGVSSGEDSEDAASLWSGVESGAEAELEEADVVKKAPCEATLEALQEDDVPADEDEDDVPAEEAEPQDNRAKWGRHVFDSDGYFVYVNNPNYPNIRVMLAGCWCQAHLMGDSAIAKKSKEIKQSKTIVIDHFDKDPKSPILSVMVLRAWACWRMQQHNFCSGHPRRDAFRQRMVANLRADVQKYGCKAGSIGHTKANELFRQWCPEALA